MEGINAALVDEGGMEFCSPNLDPVKEQWLSDEDRVSRRNLVVGRVWESAGGSQEHIDPLIRQKSKRVVARVPGREPKTPNPKPSEEWGGSMARRDKSENQSG